MGISGLFGQVLGSGSVGGGPNWGHFCHFLGKVFLTFGLKWLSVGRPEAKNDLFKGYFSGF